MALLRGQETPTEKTAAAATMRRLAELETSLSVRALVTRVSAPDHRRDEVVERASTLMRSELLALADDITRHPEVSFQETESAEKLVAYLRAHHFTVTTGQAGLATAFVARYEGLSGKPALGVMVEYDGLRGTKGPFHGDQHSAQGPVGLAAAIAIGEYLSSNHLAGSVTVFGTPAEEMMPPVKTALYRAGVFAGTDVLVRSHSSVATTRSAAGFGSCCLNIDAVKYIFRGAPAHQMFPWEGRNALEGVIHLFENIDGMRGSLRPEARIQGIISEGGAAPNVVPDRAVADFYIRYPDAVYLAQVRAMVDKAAEAAALATGTKVKIAQYGAMRDGISTGVLEELAFAYTKKYGATHVQDEPGKPAGYEETGTVASQIPGVGFNAFTSRGAYHSYEMEADALSEVGHGGFVTDAEAMTALLFDYASQAQLRAAVAREFSELRRLQGEYAASLQTAYKEPAVPEPEEK